MSGPKRYLTPGEWRELLAAHALWLAGRTEPGAPEGLCGYRLRLAGKEMREWNFRGVDLREAELGGGVFDRSEFTDVDFRGADLSGASFRGARFAGRCRLEGADLTGVDLRAASFSCPGGLRVPWHTPVRGMDSLVAVAAKRWDPTGRAPAEERLRDPDGARAMTGYCLAEWAVMRSGPAGAAMAALTSVSVAGSILLPGASHLFFRPAAEAVAWCEEVLTGGAGGGE